MVLERLFFFVRFVYSGWEVVGFRGVVRVRGAEGFSGAEWGAIRGGFFGVISFVVFVFRFILTSDIVFVVSSSASITKLRCCIFFRNIFEFRGRRRV